MQEGFELHRQHDVHKNKRQQKRQRETASGAREFFAVAAFGKDVFRGQIQFGSFRFDLFFGDAGGFALLHKSVKRHGALAARTLNRSWAAGFFERDDAVETDAAQSRGGHVELQYASAVNAKAFARANVNFVLLAAFVISRNLVAAHQQAQRTRDVGDIDAEFRRFLAINAYANFRLAQGERGVGIADFGNRFHRREQSLGVLIKFVYVRAAQFVIEFGVLRAAAAAYSRDVSDSGTQIQRLEFRQHFVAHALHQRELV